MAEWCRPQRQRLFGPAGLVDHGLRCVTLLGAAGDQQEVCHCKQEAVSSTNRLSGPPARLLQAGGVTPETLVGLARRLPLLLRPFQLPIEALQCGSGLVGPNRCLTVVAVADSHQDGNVSESFLDVSNVFIELPFLLSCERMSFRGSGHCFSL